MGSPHMTLTADTADCQYYTKSIHVILARDGGPCLLSDPNSAKKVVGPACTDNFQIIPFSFLGKTWHSVEQCYQTQKFPEGSESRGKLENCAPLPGENGSLYGHRVWRLGQTLRGMVLDWENLKKELLETGDLE